jgi:hypothetical protein
MRAIAMVVVLAGLVLARPAAAQPQGDGEKAKRPAKKANKKPAAPARPAAPPTAPGFGLGSMAAQAAGAAAAPAAGDTRPGAVDARRLDLTPRRQLETGKAGLAGDRRGSERTSGMTLGDDGDWRVQALQVGAMAAVFGALVAVCGNGSCLLPDFLGIGGRDELGPPPGLEIREQPDLRDPR